jgi:hypothetical protein
MAEAPADEPAGRFYTVVRFIGRFWVWFFFKSVDVKRRERVPPRGPVLLCILLALTHRRAASRLLAARQALLVLLEQAKTDYLAATRGSTY